MSRLESGLYTITGPALEDGLLVGRGQEDYSLLPKKVVNIGPSDPSARTAWRVEKIANGRYHLSIGGSGTTSIDGRLYAILLSEPPDADWIITFRANHRAYTIESASFGAGWILSGEKYDQTAVRPLIVGPSDPPFFPPNELFVFTPIVGDDYDNSNMVEAKL